MRWPSKDIDHQGPEADFLLAYSNFVSFKKLMMGGMALKNHTIDRYFRHLKRLDNNSKKGLIIKLTESLEFETSSTEGYIQLFGAWEDSRDSDSIICEIYNSRIDSKDLENLE